MSLETIRVLSQFSSAEAQFLADFASISFSTGDILYIDSNGDVQNLGIGTTGQVLTVSSGGLPEWSTATGGSSTWGSITGTLSDQTDLTTYVTGLPISTFTNDSGYLTTISGGDHGTLSGLSDDDHTQYALLAGRSGGQTLIGGTASGDDLTLQSTSNATKGSILFGTSAYDEVNNYLGIGITAPAQALEVRGNVQLLGGATKILFRESDAISVPVYSINYDGAGSSPNNYLKIRSEFTGYAADLIRIDQVGNTYFTIGNVGIKQVPSASYDLAIGASAGGKIKLGDGSIGVANNTGGITWHNATGYSIGMTQGTWSAPNYQQMEIRFDTGIILNPGNNTYGKSHVGVVGGMSIGSTYYTTKYHNGLIVEGNIGVGTTNPLYPVDSNKAGALVTGNWYNLARFIEPVASKGVHLGYDNSSQTAIIAAGTAAAASNLAFWTFNGAGSWSEKMRVTGVGNVGIGTTAPTTFSGYTTLAINNATAGGVLELQSNGTSAMRFATSPTLSYIFEPRAIPITFSTNNTERMRLDATGNLGIGTISANQKLTVEGTMSLKEQASANADTAAYGQLWVKTATPNQLWFTDDAGGDFQLASLAGTETLTNKRITQRVDSTTSSATPTINTDNVDVYRLTAQTVDITSFTTNLSGTPTHGQKLLIEITGTAARAITWGASFEASTVALPTTTVTTAMLSVGFIYNSATSKWRCMASA